MPIPAGPDVTSPSGWSGYRPPTLPATTTFIDLDGWVAPGVDDFGTTWIITKVGGWSSTPGLRNASVDRPLDHGQFDSASYWDARVITIEGTAVATSPTSCSVARDILTSLCAWDTASLFTLRVTEEDRPARRAMVRLAGDTKTDPIGAHAFDFSLQLKAPDPRRYDDVPTTLTLWAPTGVSGGLVLPATAPLVITPTGLSHSSVVATNLGTTPTRPVVTFAGPLVDPQIAHVPSGRSLSTLITLTAGDVLVADFDARTLMLNGSSRSSALTASAAWWELPPGGGELRFTAGGGTGTATVTFRSAWI
jgi:hypothetical protein